MLIKTFELQMNGSKTLDDSNISYCHIYTVRLVKKLNFLKGGVKWRHFTEN